MKTKVQLTLFIVGIAYLILPFVQYIKSFDKITITQLTLIGFCIMLNDLFKYFKEHSSFKGIRWVHLFFEYVFFIIIVLLSLNLGYKFIIWRFTEETLDIINNFIVFWTIGFSVLVVLRKTQVNNTNT